MNPAKGRPLTFVEPIKAPRPAVTWAALLALFPVLLAEEGPEELL